MKRHLIMFLLVVFFISTLSLAASAIPEQYRWFQTDSQWNTGEYKKYDIYHNGCGPTAIAIVFSSLTRETIKPTDIASLKGYTNLTAIDTLLPSSVEWVKANCSNAAYNRVKNYEKNM